jgi:FkbM family methyltransferase
MYIMLIDASVIKQICDAHTIQMKGVLHVGAHECEEKTAYNTVWNISDDKIIWIDANKNLIDANIRRGIPNCYVAALDETERVTTFHITNNGQSSSILELGTHKESYPNIVVVEERRVRTQTLLQFFERNMLDVRKYNVWNFDIQGVELQVLRGSKELLQFADVIYTEVNTGSVYKDCGLLPELDCLLQEAGLERVATEMTGSNWGDALYIRKSAPVKSKSITLAIPTYRRFSPFLENYIPKYLNLPYIDTILIGDETGEDIDKIKQQPWGNNPKLEFIRNPERMGAYHNKLNILRNAKTDWIALIDSDNEVGDGYFNALFEFWNSNGFDTSHVYTPAAVESRNIHESYGTRPVEHLSGIIVNRYNWNTILNIRNSGYVLNLGNCVFHTSQIQYIPENPPKDVMADCQIMNKALVENGCSLVLVPNMTYKHIVHPGSLYINTVKEQEAFQRITDWRIL